MGYISACGHWSEFLCADDTLMTHRAWLQVHMEVQAFLTLPDLTAEGAELDGHCQVIKPFSIETAVDHCVEPTSTGNYRCSPNHIPARFCGIWLQSYAPCSNAHEPRTLRDTSCCL